MAFNSTLSLLEPFDLSWDYLFEEIADRRTTKLLFMKNPVPICMIVALYLWFVLKWGPTFMKYRKPYQLTNYIIIYNLMQIAANTFLFIQGIRIWSNYNWICQSVDNSSSDFAIMSIHTCHQYFLNKLMDLADTIFFVLRKKQNQISVLHVWHHSLMVFSSWIGTKYLPGGHSSFFGVINTFIHVILYLYYLLAALGPKVHKYLWWKKYLTVLQLIQFGIIIIHQSLVFTPNCNYPKWPAVIILPNGLIFLKLFSDFYKKSYGTDIQIVKTE